jgi:hypothetical protein
MLPGQTTRSQRAITDSILSIGKLKRHCHKMTIYVENMLTRLHLDIDQQWPACRQTVGCYLTERPTGSVSIFICSILLVHMLKITMAKCV